MPTPHNNAQKGQIAKTVLMPGDPLRAKFIADTFLQDAVLVNEVRGMLAYTGTYNGKPVTVMGSGMGMPSIGIYSYELFKEYDVDRIIRIGSAGSYSSDAKIYDVVLATSAVSESTYAKVQSGYDKDESYPSKALNDSLRAAAKRLGINMIEGAIHSSDVFYRQPSDEKPTYWEKLRDERGCLRGTVYTIYEQPHTEPTPEEPAQALPASENPTLEKPMLDKPTLENPMQLITKGRNKEKQNTDQSITDSIPFPSGFPETPVQKRTEAKESFERYRNLILENIDYDVLASDPHVDREQLNEIVDLLQETVCSTRSRIRVAGNDYPTEVVRSKLLKLNGEYIRFVMDCLKQNTTRIRNIRQYLLAALFNAPSTMSSYYTALVAHDMAGAA